MRRLVDPPDEPDRPPDPPHRHTLDEVLEAHNAPHPQASADGLDLIEYTPPPDDEAGEQPDWFGQDLEEGGDGWCC
jgi:hypothetical protein